VARANVKPRLRMTALYYVANSLNYLVAGTGNRSELTIGYFTKHGDGGVDLLPLGSLMKSEVRLLAVDLGVPRAILDKPPSAGLWAGQTDEAEMGFGYADLERYLTRGPEGVAPALALRLERMIRANEHKRAMAPTRTRGKPKCKVQSAQCKMQSHQFRPRILNPFVCTYTLHSALC
jgi:NAD+ synthase